MVSALTFDISTIPGFIGAITGPVGCLIGWFSYRRSQQIKALDLRLELRKQVSDVRVDIEALPALLERAKGSRSAVRAAMGRGQQSGDNLIWEVELEEDVKSVRVLACGLPDAKETYQRSSSRKLEDKLVEVHALSSKAAKIRKKYEAALAADDKDRDRIRADAHRRFDI